MAQRRRQQSRTVVLDRSLEALPLFRLSDSADESAITFIAESGGRWRVLPAPGERLPGTFDQDVYVELLRRFHEAASPADGALRFTLHAFLRSMGRRVDGRTYEQLRAALNRLERTILESDGVYLDAGSGSLLTGRLTVLASVHIDRRRLTDRNQLALFSTLTNNEPCACGDFSGPACEYRGRTGNDHLRAAFLRTFFASCASIVSTARGRPRGESVTVASTARTTCRTPAPGAALPVASPTCAAARSRDAGCRGSPSGGGLHSGGKELVRGIQTGTQDDGSGCLDSRPERFFAPRV
jgi:Replication initiator protein A